MAACATPPRRTLHLVDIENLAGANRRQPEVVVDAVAAYRRLVPMTDDDHVVVGCDRTLAFTAADALPHARLVVGAGPDGADRALLASTADLTFVARRYQRVVIGSGDHAFCPLARQLRGRGVEVVVASRSESLATALRNAASMVIRLDAGAVPVVMPMAV